MAEKGAGGGGGEHVWFFLKQLANPMLQWLSRRYSLKLRERRGVQQNVLKLRKVCYMHLCGCCTQLAHFLPSPSYIKSQPSPRNCYVGKARGTEILSYK